MIERDELWSRSKNLISKKDDQERINHCNFDLTNYDQPEKKYEHVFKLPTIGTDTSID